MKVLHVVVGAVVLTRVPNVDLSTSHGNIVFDFVVDADTRNVVDTKQVNSPPVVPPVVVGDCTLFLIPINSSSRIEGEKST